MPHHMHERLDSSTGQSSAYVDGNLNHTAWALLQWWAATLFVVALMLLSRPYTGIRHDSVLYFGQALQQLLPDEFSRDLFFEFGSQADFTVFPKAMALLLRHITPAEVSIGLTIIGMVCFVVASRMLIKKLVSHEFEYISLLVILAIPGGYGAHNVFSYAEPFATARTFAEPLALLALAFLVGAQHTAAAILMLLALLVHPLQVLPALIVAWCWLIMRSHRWVYLAWGAVPLFALGLSGVAPFGALAVRFDSQWLEWIREPNRHVFLLRWPLNSWCQLFADVFILWVASRVLSARASAFARAVLLAVGIGFTFTFLLADIGAFVLATGLQTWRVQWIAHWTALMLMPAVVMTLWRKGEEVPKMQAVFLIATSFFGAPAGSFAIAIAAPLTAAFFVVWPRIAVVLTPNFKRFVAISLGLAVSIAFLKFVLAISGSWDTFNFTTVATLLIHPVPLFSFIALTVWLHCRIGQSPALMVIQVVLVTGLAWWAAVHWDRRSTWSQVVERIPVSASSPFGVELPSNARVYWADELLAPWLVLHRASYWNGHQEAGLLFNRRTAQAAAHRSKIVSILELHGAICHIQNQLGDGQTCKPDLEAVTAACDASAGALNFVVLPYDLPLPVLGTWAVPSLAAREEEITYRLFGCPASPPEAPVRRKV